jgi:hypothetical protein
MVVLAPLLKQFLGLRDARWICVHEVDVRLSLGKRVPLGRLPETLLRRSTMDLVQPVRDKWNVVSPNVIVIPEQPSSSPNSVMKIKYLPLRLVNDLMHPTEM